MEIDENSYILGYWFASDGENNWYLMMEKKDGKWTGEQTFRYNVDDGDPFAEKDRKNKTTVSIAGETPEQEVIDKINGLFEIIKLKYNDFSDYFIVKGNGSKFIDIARTKDYIHLKTVQ